VIAITRETAEFARLIEIDASLQCWSSLLGSAARHAV
jgi:hypothetical protein